MHKSYSLKLFFTLSVSIFCQTQSQIESAKKYIKNSGMTDQQVIDAAKKRGYTDKQIEKVIIDQKQNVDDKKIESRSKKFTDEDYTDSKIQDKNPYQVNNKNEDEEIDEKEEFINLTTDKNNNKSISLEYFGYDIFKQDPKLFQASSVGAIDPEYLIGPGDEIIVMLWGETQFRQVLKVDREGFIFIPDIGQVFVNGLNLRLLESKLFRVLSQSFSSLDPYGREATTFLDVSIGNLRPLKIQVVGEVAQPGVYTVSPSTTLFSSLYYFNGPTKLGSLRDIRLIRGGKEIRSIDFYNYLLSGKKPLDENLQLDDVIFIPKRKKSISIDGEINRPGIYELKEKETFSDILKMAGGLKVSAYLDRAQIDRIVPFEQRDSLKMDRMYTDLNLNKLLKSKLEYELYDGDKIKVFSVLDMRSNAVQITGSVTRPGTYDLQESLNIKTLVANADGLLGDAFLNRVDIVRINPDLSEKLIKLNLGKALEGDEQHNIPLQGLDIVIIYGKNEMINREFVSIKGHVKKPGTFILRDNMNVYDLVFLGGGLFDSEFRNNTYLERAELVTLDTVSNQKEIIPFDLNKLLNGEGIADRILENNDEVHIYSKIEIQGDLNFVNIKGHVKKPGKYELFENNMTVRDLVFRSGGFNDPIHLSKTYLKRADIIRLQKNRIESYIIPFDLGEVLSDESSSNNIKLFPEDLVTIYSKEVFNDIKPITILGIVNNPGEYEYKKSMSLKDLILESGGISAKHYRYRVEVSRIDPQNKSDEILAKNYTFNLDNNYELEDGGELSNDTIKFLLKPFDLVQIRPDPYFNIQKVVKVSGEVYYPGDFVILNAGEKISDILERAGGLKPNAFLEASSFVRGEEKININMKKILRRPKSNENLIVYDGDRIIIQKKPNLYEIIGEVNSAGKYSFEKNLRVRDVIKNAGGLTPNSDTDNIFITYPNGRSKKYVNRFFNPKVLDGSVIVVSRKKEEEPFDSTEFAKELTSILANLAQVVSFIIIANR